MSNLKLQEYGEYAYGLRGVLQPGDKFRVSGGPFYQNDDGTKTSMAERGTFVFRRYCEKARASGSRPRGSVVKMSSCRWARP